MVCTVQCTYITLILIYHSHPPCKNSKRTHIDNAITFASWILNWKRHDTLLPKNRQQAYITNTFMVFRQTPMTIAGKIAKSKSRVTFICKMLWLHVSCSFAYGIRSHIVWNACKSQRFIVYIIQCVQELYSRQQYRS